MKKQKARGQVRRFLRRSIACLLAIVGMGMAAVTAGLPQPLGWLGGLGGIQTAMAAQAPAGDGRFGDRSSDQSESDEADTFCSHSLFLVFLPIRHI